MQEPKSSSPDYRKIFNDILEMKYPEKKQECQGILGKKHLTFLDVVRLDQKIFGIGDKKTKRFNQRERVYDILSRVEILNYQAKNRLNNSQVAVHFNLSRNTLTKWKKELKE